MNEIQIVEVLAKHLVIRKFRDDDKMQPISICSHTDEEKDWYSLQLRKVDLKWRTAPPKLAKY